MNRRNIALDLVLTLLLCGLWNIVVQYDQCKTMNILLREEKYNFTRVCIFSLLTCGLYLIYHEYRKAHDFAVFKNPAAPDQSDEVIAVVCTIFGLNWVFDAFFQYKINQHIDEQNSILSE